MQKINIIKANFNELNNYNSNKNNSKIIKDNQMADFIGISSRTSSVFLSQIAGTPQKLSTTSFLSPSFICVYPQLSFIFPWVMLNHRKEFRRIGGFTADVKLPVESNNQRYSIFQIFYNFHFFLTIILNIMLIFNCNFNLVLWKNAKHSMQINDS